MPANALAEIPPRASHAPLYQLLDEAAQLEAILEQIAGLDDYDEARGLLLTQLDALGLGIEERAAACCAALRNAEAEEAMCKDEAKRFADRARGAANRQESIKQYLRACLDSAGLAKLAAGPHKVSIVANGGREPRDTERINREVEPLMHTDPSQPTDIPGVYIKLTPSIVVDDDLLPESYRLERGKRLSIR